MPVFSIEQGCVTQREHNRIRDFLGACSTGPKLSGILPKERSRWSEVVSVPCLEDSPSAIRLRVQLLPRESVTRPWDPVTVTTEYISEGGKKNTSTRLLRSLATHNLVERYSQAFADANSDTRSRIREMDAFTALVRMWMATGLVSGIEVTDEPPVVWPPSDGTLFAGCKGRDTGGTFVTDAESPPAVWWYFAWRDKLPPLAMRCLIIRGCSSSALEAIQDIIEQAGKVCCWDLQSARARQPKCYRPLDCASQPVMDLQALFIRHVLPWRCRRRLGRPSRCWNHLGCLADASHLGRLRRPLPYDEPGGARLRNRCLHPSAPRAHHRA